MDCSPESSLSTGFSVHLELPCPTPGGCSDPGIETVAPETLALKADSLPSGPPGKPQVHHTSSKFRHTRKKALELTPGFN